MVRYLVLNTITDSFRGHNHSILTVNQNIFLSLHTNFDFYYSSILRNSSLIFYFTFIYSIDLSDGNSTGKEKKKKDDIIDRKSVV